MERILHIDRLLREEGYPCRRDIADAFEVSIKSDDFRIDDYIDPNSGIFTKADWFKVRIRAAGWMADILCEHLEAGSYERTDPDVGLFEISW